MEIRKIRLPQDIDDLSEISLASFQYPDNPEWSIQQDEAESLHDQIASIKRFWLLLRIGGVFSPTLRYLFQGYVCEEDGQMIGTLMYQCPHGIKDEYYINNVAVHPDQRRRGIARKLVETALGDMRAKNGKKVCLDVIAGNLPAYRLYESLGWEHFSGSAHLTLDGGLQEDRPLPEGFSVVQLPASNWRVSFEIARRITPQNIQRYNPVEETRYRESPLMRLLEPLIGTKVFRMALRDSTGTDVGFGIVAYRTRPGGTNNMQLLVDPEFDRAVPGFLCALMRKAEQLAPGRKLELASYSWLPGVAKSAEELGFQPRYEYHKMGLFLK